MPTLDLARSDLDTALTLNPQIFWAYPEKIALEILAARWVITKDQAPEVYFDAAAAAASKALAANPRNAVAYQSAAEINRWRAEHRLRQGLSIRADVREGRRLVERALALNPGLANALVTGAAITTVQAESESAEATRRALAAEADDALRRALEINPDLERETGELRRRIEAVSN